MSREAFRLVRDLGDDPAPWVEQVIGELGTPPVLVNNVGMMDGRPFLELPMAEVERSIRIMRVGTWALTRAVTLPMVEQQLPGCVVSNWSSHSRRVRMCPDYSACKAALRMLVNELVVELGPHGIRVSGVAWAVDTWSDYPTPVMRQELGG